MVYIVAGYPVEYSDAKLWAQRRFPGIRIPQELGLPYYINRYLEQNNLPPACIGFDYPHLQAKCFFITHGRVDRSSTATRYRRFREDEKAKAIKQFLFGDHIDEFDFIKELQFVTVPDPYKNGLPT